MAHIKPQEVNRSKIKTPSDWLGVGYEITQLVNTWSNRTDLVVLVNAEAGKGAPACYLPMLAEIEVNTKEAFGEIVKSGIHTYGETVHIFVERKNYKGVFMPGYVKLETEYHPTSTGLKYIDHMVGNVELGMMNIWAKFYGDVLGFANLITFDDKDISTQYTALMSKVMCNGNGRIKFPINEPAYGKKKSQIEEYLDFYQGPGCQHIAVASDDIVFTISEMRKRGVEFLYVPGTYYDTVKDRVGIIGGGECPVGAMSAVMVIR